MVVRIIKKGNVTSKEVVKAKLPPLTLRQSEAVKIAKSGKHKSKANILRKAGFSEAIARNPHLVFNSKNVKEHLNPTISKMEQIREKSLDALIGKPLQKEGAFNLTMIASTMTKDIELLSGRPTERTAYTLSDDEKDRLRKLAKINKK